MINNVVYANYLKLYILDRYANIKQVSNRLIQRIE